jgi:hypothetical protein
LLVACAVAIAVLAITVGGPDPPPSERQVERQVRALSARRGFPLHTARCIRDKTLPRSFVCLVDGPFDMHLAWRVRWISNEHLELRRPDGTPIQF